MRLLRASSLLEAIVILELAQHLSRHRWRTSCPCWKRAARRKMNTREEDQAVDIFLCINLVVKELLVQCHNQHTSHATRRALLARASGASAAPRTQPSRHTYQKSVIFNYSPPFSKKWNFRSAFASHHRRRHLILSKICFVLVLKCCDDFLRPPNVLSILLVANFSFSESS